MKKLKAFIYVFKQSISSFSYYKDILNTKFSFSIKYLAVLAILLSLITSGAITGMETPKLLKFINEQKPNILAIYPDNFEITSNNNEWNINQPEPFAIKMPDFLKVEESEGVTNPENLIVFNREGTLNDFENANSLMLLNKSNLLVKSTDKIEVNPLQDIPNGTFTKDMYTVAVDKILELAKYIPVFMFLFLTVGFFFYFFVFRLVYLLFVAVALVIINIFVKPDVEYKDLYRIALHAMTIPLLIEVLFIIVGISVTTVPWFLLLNIVLGTLVITKALKIDD